MSLAMFEFSNAASACRPRRASIFPAASARADAVLVADSFSASISDCVLAGLIIEGSPSLEILRLRACSDSSQPNLS